MTDNLLTYRIAYDPDVFLQYHEKITSEISLNDLKVIHDDKKYCPFACQNIIFEAFLGQRSDQPNDKDELKGKENICSLVRRIEYDP